MSGNALPGCGSIHKDEVHPTLVKLSDDLDFPFDLNDYILGSTGKKDYSGDIDVVLDKKWYSGGAKNLRKEMIELIGDDNVNLNGALLHIKYPIVNYDSTKNERQPRTGFVQVDFNFGDYKLLKFFNWAPGNESKFKGLHRNIALSSVAGVVNAITFSGRDDRDRPIEQIRWKWSPKGLMKVKRISKQKADGSWNKEQIDIDLKQTITDPALIAKTLLQGTVDDMNSLETIVAAVNRAYSDAYKTLMFQRMAQNFSEKAVLEEYTYPPEIAQYL
jgi:hypothetical protein